MGVLLALLCSIITGLVIFLCAAVLIEWAKSKVASMREFYRKVSASPVNKPSSKHPNTKPVLWARVPVYVHPDDEDAAEIHCLPVCDSSFEHTASADCLCCPDLKPEHERDDLDDGVPMYVHVFSQ